MADGQPPPAPSPLAAWVWYTMVCVVAGAVAWVLVSDLVLCALGQITVTDWLRKNPVHFVAFVALVALTMLMLFAHIYIWERGQ